MESVDTLAQDIKYIRLGIDDLKTQTTKTNGRVTELEKTAIVLKVVMWGISALGVPTLLMLINRGIINLFS